MKQSRYIILSFLFGMSTLAVTGQTHLGGIKVSEKHVVKKTGHTANVKMDLDLTAIPDMNSNLLMVVTPIIRSNTSNDQVALRPFLLMGNRRYRIIDRRIALDKHHIYNQPDTKPSAMVKRRNGKEQSMDYSAATPYRPWMRHSSMILLAENSGCADCPLGSEETTLTDDALVPLYEADYQYEIIVPEGELLKKREETLSAHLAYQVGKYVVLPQFDGNPAELARIDSKLKEIGNDSDIIFEKLSMVGYASPEGGVEYNAKLSKDRAHSFASYLVNKYPILKSRFEYDWKGQDWAGLRTAVTKSELSQKDAILEIIDQKPVGERTAALRAIDGGSLYATLLSDYYPPLRRSELTFHIVVKGFELDKAREIIKTHPSRLSLAEVYAVAQSYPEGSHERYETWTIAEKTFPKAIEPTANAAIIDLRAGRYPQALARLEARKSEPKLWMLLGLAYAYSEKWAEAESYLTRAAQQGRPGAQHNLNELRRYMQDNL